MVDSPCCWPGGSFGVCRYKLLGAVDTRRYPRAENRVWSDQEDHEERGSKDRAVSTCGPHSDSFNDTSRRRHSNCSTISRHLAEANLKSKRPFRALPLTPEHRQLGLKWCQADQCGMSQIGQRLCLVMNPGLFWGQRITVYMCGGALVSGTILPTLFYVTLPAQLV
ncbi:HTH_Tnp_Tc3_2 domain-containing protein [Trichonephila clavipes]|nr:HTH_Tnp_Tc3_2 domain-containing protein [Trichonephila clavipes]